MQNLISFIQNVGEVIEFEEIKADKLVQITARIPQQYIKGIKQQIEDYKLLQYKPEFSKKQTLPGRIGRPFHNKL
jgi:hypothetical protein